MQPNNLVTEVSVLVISVLLILAGSVLLFFGKIDATFATLMFGLVAAIYGVNSAYKAPSPVQQAQLGTLLTQVLSLLPQQPTSTPTPKP